MKFTFTDVPDVYVNLIAEALDLLPYGRVKPVAQFLQAQINIQLAQVAQEKTDVSKES